MLWMEWSVSTIKDHAVIYKRVVARKIRLMRRFSLFCLMNKKNKQADKISGQLVGGCLFGDKQLLWSGQTVLSDDTLGTASGSIGRWLLFGLFMCSQFQTPAPENATHGKNMIGWKIDFFFIPENFLGILDRLYLEPMHRRHDFLSLTLLLGQHLIAVLFFYWVDVCGSVFCVF